MLVYRRLLSLIYKKCRCPMAIVFLLVSISVMNASGSYLTAKGSKLYNDKGEIVRLTGVNWFGFETTNMFPHGLWARDYHGVLLQIKSMGFNCIRIPFCDEMLSENAKPDKPNFYGEDPWYKRDKLDFNKELAGLKPLEMLDEIVRFANVLGLVVILDNHSREHDGYMNEKIWYTSKITEETWINNWVMLAKRYRNNPAVVGFDLENEPHGKTVDGGSTWNTGNEVTDWNVAAQKCGNAILAENPNVLIIIEGVEQYDTTMYWWGGNLRAIENCPIKLSKPEKLVYSPHEYGPEVFQQPWFFDSTFPENMEKIWDDAFGFVAKKGIAPLFVGEFGISSLDSYQGKAGTWFKLFVKYMADNLLSWTFWALNPNSGDTGGILSNDWVSVVQWKLDEVKNYCAPLINEPLAVKEMRHVGKTTDVTVAIANGVLGVTTKMTNGVLELYTIDGTRVRSVKNTRMPVANITHGVYSVVWRGVDKIYSKSIMIE
ncbi:MAG TPA: glycoside hydrolase family 5 protein [Chitinispirillaceae bacterium]|nr:glycoside hydrolase family 5 protein [Chitinispirillaceae bacterium]